MSIWIKNLLFLSICINAVYFKASAEQPPDIQRIIKRGELVVAMYDQDLAPYFFKKNNIPQGIDVDLSEAFAKSLGVKLKIKLLPKADQYSDILNELKDQNVDLVLAGLYPSLERSKEVRFGEGYDSINFLFLLNRKTLTKKNIRIVKEADLNSPSINLATYTSSIFNLIKSITPKSIVNKYEKRNEVHDQCLSENVHACFVDELDYLRWKKAYPAIHILVDKLKTSYQKPIVTAVHWKNHHLAYWIDQAIRSYKIDGTMDSILRKHDRKVEE